LQSEGQRKEVLVQRALLHSSAGGPFSSPGVHEAVEKRDAEQVSRLAHASVGSAASIGARQFQSCMRAAELCATEGNWIGIMASIKAIDEAWIRLAAAIEQKEKEDA